MSELRRAWRDVGRSGFCSAPVLLAFLAWTIPSTVYIDVAVSGEPLLPWLGAAVVTSLLVALLLWLTGQVSRRRWPDGPGPGAALTVYATAGALRGLLLWSDAEVLGLTSSVGLTSRVVNSAAWTIVFLGATSIVVTRQSDHGRLMDGLAHRRQELLALQSTLGERIEQTHRRLVAQVQDELGPTLAQLRAALDSLALTSDSGIDDAVARFRTAVANVVRPLSRTLAEPGDEPAATAAAAPTPESAVAAERLPVSEAIAPKTIAGLVLVLLALLALAVAPETYRTPGTPTRALAFVVVLWLGFEAVRWAARRTRWQATVPVLLASLAAIYAVLAVVAGAVARVVTSELSSPTTTFPALATTLSAVAALAVTLAVVTQRLARMAELRSAETVAELDVLTAVLRRELWRERRRLALTVHGPIQSALVAAAVTMSRPGFTPDQVPALAGSLDQAMAHIDRAAGAPPLLQAAARDLASLWVDSAEVAFTASGDASGAIDGDEALRTVVIEVMREAVSNAVRHGAADAVTLVVTRPAEGIVRIVSDDDGDGPPIAPTPGLGSAMLDEVALDWSLTRSGATTRLEVELGIEP